MKVLGFEETSVSTAEFDGYTACDDPGWSSLVPPEDEAEAETAELVTIASRDLLDLTAGGGDPLVGRELEEWRPTGILGCGTMGTVYRARHAVTGDAAAIKVLSSQLAGDAMCVERFIAEARVFARIQHPDVVAVHDVGMTSDGRPYLVMDLIDGCSLATLVARRIQPEIAWTVAIMVRVARALGAAHARGVLHRDVKPANILVSRDGRARLSDFGLATASASPGSGELLVGTTAYVAPEQAMGRAEERSDLYSLGVALYEVLCGVLPCRAATQVEIVPLHLEEPLAPPSHLRPDVPPALEGVILRAMEKRPEHRFQSAEEMAVALEAAMAAPYHVVHGPNHLARTVVEPLPVAPPWMIPGLMSSRLGALPPPRLLAICALVVLAGFFAGYTITP